MDVIGYPFPYPDATLADAARFTVFPSLQNENQWLNAKEVYLHCKRTGVASVCTE